MELYGLYTQYAELADSPKGSLLEFNKTRNNLSSEISKLFNQFNILLPNLNEKKFWITQNQLIYKTATGAVFLFQK